MSDYHPLRAQSPLRPGRRIVGEEETGSPVTACRRCRKQKLRCSRDLPTCKRCKDVSAVCDYPPPPDRKALAAQRLQNAKARARRESESSGSLQGQRRLSADTEAVSTKQPEPSIGVDHHGIEGMVHSEASEGRQHGRKTVSDHCRTPSPPLQATLGRITLPSSEVAIFLIEIYFSRVYNAHLIFHKKTFLSDYAANRVPDFVALSIFALASIFLRQSNGQASQDGDDGGDDFGISMLSTVDSTKQGYEWATAASQRVLMQADIPRIETVQACQNLGLYWFSQGEGERTHMHFLIAYKMARLLNLHVQQESSEQRDTFANEAGRRCFWACWITSCISQDNATFKNDPWKEVVGLAFPSDEISYASTRPLSSETFDAKGDVVSLEEGSVENQASVMGELVKLFCIWWEIQHFVKQHGDGKSSDSSAKFAALLELDRRLDLVFEKLHSGFRYLNATSFASPKLDPYSLFQLNCVYHFGSCALHSSIVPLFSNTPSNPQVSRKLLRLSAEQAMRHAAIMLDMATAFLSIRPDVSRLPSVTGFAMFVAATIHFRSLVAQRKLQTYGAGRLKAAVSILERLKEYWAALNGLWSQLRSLFALAGLDIDIVSTSQNRSRSGSDEQPTDFEKIVSHKGTPEEGGTASADLYTYVVDQENKGASPRRHSDARSPQSQARRTSAHNTPSPGTNPVVAPGKEVQKESAAIPLIGRRDSGMQQTYSDPSSTSYQQIPNPHNPHSPGPHGFDHGFRSNDSMRQDVGRMAAGIPNNFIPLGTVSEEFPMHDTRMDQMAGPMPGFEQGVSGYADPGVMAMEMDIDGINLWWDQPYGTFETDVNQMNPRVEGGGGYNFQNFAFG